MRPAAAVTRDDLLRAVHELDLDGRPVGVHSSLRSFRRLEGGADTFVDAFLDSGCTLLVPSHSWGFASNHVPGMRPPRNGWDYSMSVASPFFRGVFAAESDDVDRNMGAIPRAVLARAGRVRGNHPLASFTALGPLAHELVDGQSGDAVHAPLRALADQGGALLLVGVPLTRLTLLHLAEQEAGRVQFRRWALDAHGETLMVESGGCSEGFERLAPVLTPVETRIDVGPSAWRCLPAAEVLRRAADVIRADPGITHCDQRFCVRCEDASAGGPVLDG